jgi:ribosomal protein L13
MVGEVYSYKGNEYQLQGYIRIKNPDTRQWQTHAIYIDKNNDQWGRLATEFAQRFKCLGKSTFQKNNK